MAMPAGSVDVHAHVLDPCRPAAPDAEYDLFDAPIDEYQAHLTRLGIQFGVLVTASAHGTDNQPLLGELSSGELSRVGDDWSPHPSWPSPAQTSPAQTSPGQDVGARE